MKKTVAGIDEAGRGAVIGPMVIAGVAFDSKNALKLRKMGVRDSKELSHSVRIKLAKQIEKLAKNIAVLRVGPCRIDDYAKQGVNLNRLEAMKMANIIDLLSPGRVYIDSPQVSTEKFKTLVKSLMKNKNVEIIAENQADVRYPVVSAASIVAKVEREKAMDELRKTYGVEGSGYPSDERTIEWMKRYLREHKKFPEKELVRFSWETTKEILRETKQKGILGFLKKKK